MFLDFRDESQIEIHDTKTIHVKRIGDFKCDKTTSFDDSVSFDCTISVSTEGGVSVDARELYESLNLREHKIDYPPFDGSDDYSKALRNIFCFKYIYNGVREYSCDFSL